MSDEARKAIKELCAQLTQTSVQLRSAKERIEELEQQIQAWHECAKYDVTMGGAVFSGRWDRSALDRCRKKYIDDKECLE